MLSTAEALATLLSAAAPISGTESIPTLEALNRVLSADVISPLDVPPMNTSSMDGYAIRTEDLTTADGNRRLPISQRIPAGHAPEPLKPGSLSSTPILPIDDVTSGYYLRLRVADVTGVLADITRILADRGISIDALLQKESEQVDANGKGETDIILITHETVEKNVNAAIRTIEALKTVVSQVTKLRMEALN